MNRRSRQVAMIFFILVSFVAAGFFAQSVGAQNMQPPPAPSTASPAQPSSQQVQGYTLTPDQEAKAIAYARARHELFFLDNAYGLLLLVMIVLVLRHDASPAKSSRHYPSAPQPSRGLPGRVIPLDLVPLPGLGFIRA